MLDLGRLSLSIRTALALDFMKMELDIGMDTMLIIGMPLIQALKFA